MLWEMLKSGNIHPVLVHFPLVLMFLAWGAQTLAWLHSRERWERSATLLLYLSAVSALITATSGYWAADQLGHDAPGHEMVHAHRDVMVLFTVLTIITALLLLIKRLRTGWLRWLIYTVLSVIMLFGADRGASLVFRYGMGVKMITSPHHEDVIGDEAHEEDIRDTDHETHTHDEDDQH